MKLHPGILLTLSLAIFAVGCGGSAVDEPDLGEVSGVITVDGAPGKNLEIQFQPDAAGGAPSVGRTDESGKYTLKYKETQTGAAIGKHTVRIIGVSSGGGGPAGGDTGEVIPVIPAKYNTQTTLSAEVKAGKNPSIDFKLQTK